MSEWWDKRAGVTKVSLFVVVILGIVVVVLLWWTACQTTIVSGKPVRYGWSNALSIFMLSTKPFGLGLGAQSVLLAICGFIAVPAAIGAVAGIVLGEILTAKKETLQTYVAEVVKGAANEAFELGKESQAASDARNAGDQSHQNAGDQSHQNAGDQSHQKDPTHKPTVAG